jgi:maleate isomerase
MGRNINNLKPDGHGWRARLGVLTHDDSAISESELWTMAPDGVSLHTSRVFFADPSDLR